MKVIFFDIDGTLDDEEGRIPSSTVEAVRRVREGGALAVINTGRPFSHILPGISAMGFDGYVCSCGQLIVLNGEIKKKLRPSPTQSERVIRLSEKYRIDGYFESEDGALIAFCHPLNSLISFQIKDFTARGIPVLFGYDKTDFNVDKFCFWAEKDSDAEAFIEELSDIYTVIRRGAGVFEMVMNGCSKAFGMREFLEMAGCPDAETYAIGDSTNDIPMLLAAQHPIAMGGAPEAVVNIAEFVTDTVEKDGLYKALEHYKLI